MKINGFRKQIFVKLCNELGEEYQKCACKQIQ